MAAPSVFRLAKLAEHQATRIEREFGDKDLADLLRSLSEELTREAAGHRDATRQLSVDRKEHELELKAVQDAGFRLAPDLQGKKTLWCKECGRDSGYHSADCLKRYPAAIGDVGNAVKSEGDGR